MARLHKIQFPHPDSADTYGIVASGGELSPDFLISAYSQGIFPWFNDDEPILWWSPDPRMVLYPKEFRISKSFRQVIRNTEYEIKIDESFREVICQCASIRRKKETGTWITNEMIEAYVELHNMGFAHSFETWMDNELVGGLYGISLGRAFFGESMFFNKTNASKLALHALVDFCRMRNFHFIDVQQSTGHLKSLGAVEVERKIFLKSLDEALQYESYVCKWHL